MVKRVFLDKRILSGNKANVAKILCHTKLVTPVSNQGRFLSLTKLVTPVSNQGRFLSLKYSFGNFVFMRYALLIRCYNALEFITLV